MDTIHQGVITLIKSALTGNSYPLPKGFNLEQADKLIISQSLVPMAYQGAYTCGISPETAIMQKYRMKYYQNLIRSEQQLRAAEQLFRVFEENGIDYMPMKGCILKQLYPQPELRPMGDADILIRMEQYDKIRPLMLQLQYKEGVESSYDFHWHGKHLLVELHRRLFSPNQKDLYRYFQEGWPRAIKEADGRYSYSLEDTYVYIFSHMAKHFRFCGIGARQIVDLYIYRRAYPQMREELVEQAMRKIGLLDFYRNIRTLLEVWFEDRPSDSVTECITAYVFSSGSFGTMENKLYTEEVLKAVKQGSMQNAKCSSLLRALFPPLSDMQLSYNILYRRAWLYPVFWVVRWIDVFMHRRKNIVKKLGIIFHLSDKTISDHQKMLNFMGLDFDYQQDEEH